MNEYRREGNFERPILTMLGIAMRMVLLAMIAAEAFGIVTLRGGFVRIAPFLGIAIVFVAAGFYMLQPNQVAVLTLFGSYLGTDRKSGLRWTLPWNMRRRLSVRARNHNIDTLKVNDKRGNPVEIAAVVVWRGEDTAQAALHGEDLVHLGK